MYILIIKNRYLSRSIIHIFDLIVIYLNKNNKYKTLTKTKLLIKKVTKNIYISVWQTKTEQIEIEIVIFKKWIKKKLNKQLNKLIINQIINWNYSIQANSKY